MTSESKKVLEILKKLDVTRNDLGFEEEVKISKDNYREKQRKVWKEQIQDLRRNNLKIERCLAPDKDYSQEWVVLGVKKKKKKGKLPFTGEKKPSRPFDKFAVLTVVQHIMDQFQEYLPSYPHLNAKAITKSLASLVLQEVYRLNFNRHKLIVMVRLIEELQQYKRTVMTYLWDADYDGHFHFNHRGSNFSLIISVIGMYID